MCLPLHWMGWLWVSHHVWRVRENFRRSLLEGNSACCSGEKLPLSWQQNKVFLCSTMILTETKEWVCVCVWGPFCLLAVLRSGLKCWGERRKYLGDRNEHKFYSYCVLERTILKSEACRHPCVDRPQFSLQQRSLLSTHTHKHTHTHTPTSFKYPLAPHTSYVINTFLLSGQE